MYPHAARALAGGVVVVTPGLGAGDLDFLLGRVHVDNVVAVVVGAVAAGQVDFLDGVDDGVTVLVVARDTLKIVGPVVFCGHDPGLSLDWCGGRAADALHELDGDALWPQAVLVVLVAPGLAAVETCDFVADIGEIEGVLRVLIAAVAGRDGLGYGVGNGFAL